LVCVGFDDLKHGSAEKLVREMRMIKTERMVQEGEVGGSFLTGIVEVHRRQ
jgi:hypothetical protein